MQKKYWLVDCLMRRRNHEHERLDTRHDFLLRDGNGYVALPPFTSLASQEMSLSTSSQRGNRG